jgi:hypothetical protein
MPETALDASALVVVRTLDLQKVRPKGIRLLVDRAYTAAGRGALVPAGPVQNLFSLPKHFFSVLLILGMSEAFECLQDPVAIPDGDNAHLLQIGVVQSVGDGSVDLMFLEQLAIVSQIFIRLNKVGDLVRGPFREVLVHNALTGHYCEYLFVWI